MTKRRRIANCMIAVSYTHLVENTKKRILEHQMEKRADVFLESHAKMQKYAKEETVDCIVFNFGYLPGGDHQLATKADTSIEAIRQGLRLLKVGGMMSLCIYSGGDSLSLIHI